MVIHGKLAWCAAFLVLLLAAGCEDAGPPVPTTPAVLDSRGPSSSDAPYPPYRGQVVVEGSGAMLGNDAFVLNEAAITGDTLTISASYSGGCRAHAFTLVIAASFAESSPVQLAAVLRHQANGDPCEAFPTETYAFDLALVRTRYREAYGPGPGKVALQIDGVPADHLVYEFTA